MGLILKKVGTAGSSETAATSGMALGWGRWLLSPACFGWVWKL